VANPWFPWRKVYKWGCTAAFWIFIGPTRMVETKRSGYLRHLYFLEIELGLGKRSYTLQNTIKHLLLYQNLKNDNTLCKN
jgi:hypothetical protein